MNNAILLVDLLVALGTVATCSHASLTRSTIYLSICTCLHDQQVLKLIVSDDTIEIDLGRDKRLAVNRVSIPLPAEDISSPSVGFSLVSPCLHGPLLYASRSAADNSTLHVELPIHGLILDILSEDDILIKVGSPAASNSRPFPFIYYLIIYDDESVPIISFYRII